MVFEELGIAFIGAIFGTIFGFFISIFWEHKKERKELKKLKQLLRDDYKRLHDIMQKSVLLVTPYLESKEKMNKFIEELISNKLDIQSVTKFYVPLDFNFWKVIADSGSLIKLELDEIKHIESTYEFINTFSSFVNRDHTEWTDMLTKKIGNIDNLIEDDKKEISHSTTNYFTSVQEYCQDMIKVLDKEAENFDWIKHHKK